MPQENCLDIMSINVGRFLDRKCTVSYLNRLGNDLPLPDVILVQDIPFRDISLFEKWPHVSFAPMTNHIVNGERMVVGIAICSRYLITHITHRTYWGDGILKNLEGINKENQRYLGEESDRLVEATEDRVLICAQLHKDGVDYELATTHGMWTRGGVTTDAQWTSMLELRAQLQREAVQRGGLVFVGDLNAGRGGVIYQMLTKELRDWVPSEVSTTLDPEHPVSKKGINVVTDFVMTADTDCGHYKVGNFFFHTGASDHQVLSARVVKA